MAKVDNPGIWEKIQKNVQETERLMGQKKYNQSMIKARQTLEYMVKLKCDQAGIVESSLDHMIHELYDGQWISKSTAEHYLQILSIGNKAAREGDNSAYNANQAYHVLSQEIYSFTDADKAAPRPRRSQTQSRQAGSRKKQPSKGGLGLNPADMVKLLVPVVLIVVLVLVIRLLTPDKDPTDETVASIPTTAATTEATTAEAPSEETSAETVSYKTTDTLNVRKEPSTDADRIGKLDPGASVEYIRDHDDFWAVILYNDQEAYVAKQYLTAGECSENPPGS